jgi:hypothetical protein
MNVDGSGTGAELVGTISTERINLISDAAGSMIYSTRSKEDKIEMSDILEYLPSLQMYSPAHFV